MGITKGMKGGGEDEKGFEQEGSGKGGILLDWSEEGSERESGQGVPQVKILKELTLQVLQLLKKRQIWRGLSYLPFSFVLFL
jgi:hypothetical protein